MNQSEIEALLGRSLSTREVNNLTQYLDIAKENVESLLCLSLDKRADGATATQRTYKAREGYSTVFTDIFTSVESVTVDGEAVTEYTPAFWDNLNSTYFNSLVFDEANENHDVVITAKWGFSSIPSDLQRLWAQAFALVSKASRGGVKSKKVEDFAITYGDLSDDEQFIKDNARVIGKYSMCTIGSIRHGEV